MPTITLGTLGLLTAGWVIAIWHLTLTENRAYLPEGEMGYGSDHLPVSAGLQGILDDYSAQLGEIGLQLTVIFPDGATWSGVAGYADIARQYPLTLQHHLYLGSMTKLFTAALVMEQVEKGTLSLGDTVDHWVDLPNGHDITIRSLLSHTSGLPDYARDVGFQIRWLGLPAKTWRPIELVRVVQNKRLRFDPGSQYEYSNSNYLLLGMILEKATGKSYSEILDETAREKLGLQDTFFLDYPVDLVIANGYDETLLHLGRRNLSGFRRSLESGAYAAGGILSTSDDVARFAHALFRGRVVSETSLADMKDFTDAPDEDIPEQTGYGLGIRHLVIAGEDLVGHTGSIPGYSGIVMHIEQKGYTVAILSNLSTIEQIKLLSKIYRVVLSWR